MKPLRTIKFVARHTGLTVHTIRIWEKRHRAVRPVRANNNRRLFSEADVDRLRLLRQATQAGHSIGQIARASIAELRRLTRDELGLTEGRSKGAKDERAQLAADFIGAALGAVKQLDGARFTNLLDRAAVEVGSPAVLQDFIAPLADQIGERWRSGKLSVLHEHFATSLISGFLANFARPYSPSELTPQIILATPTGQLHELGAIIAAAAARSHGWRAIYLGASLPIEELIGAATALKPKAVGLSIVFPPDDEMLRKDLGKLRKLLPRSCSIVIGGRSAENYLLAFGKHGAIYVESLSKFYPILDKLNGMAAARR